MAGRVIRTWVLSWLGIAMFLVAGSGAMAQAENAVEAPIFPDVWGREMPLPADLTSSTSVGDPAMNVAGRLLISYFYVQNRGTPEETTRSGLYDFFAGEIIHEWVNGKAEGLPGIADDFEFLEQRGYIFLPRVTDLFSDLGPSLADGGRLRNTESWTFPVMAYGLEKVDASGDRVFHHMIVYVGDQPTYYQGNSRGDLMDGRSFGYVFSKAVFPIVYALPDGTFLVTDAGGRLVLRYHGNLESPFIEESGKVVLVDPEETTELYDKNLRRSWRHLSWIRELHPEQPWIALEFTDALMTEHFKKLIDERGN